MDLRKLKKLIDLVEESGIAEIEVTEGEEKVRITRATAAPAPVYAAPAHVAAPAPAPAAAPAAAAAPAPAAPAARDLSNAQKSPMVGTFYRAPGPN
ncbi:MAG: acetyl-CoA carboxylase biotin carboxyl carrier protein, partial [Neisseria sp.]